jgi:hypothetical protein
VAIPQRHRKEKRTTKTLTSNVPRHPCLLQKITNQQT